MTQYVINIGAIPNDGTGDPLRTAFNETNLNFDQVFAAGPVLSNIQIANNTILTTTTNGNLILAPNGVGVVQSNVNIVPNTANIRNLGSATQRWSTVYAQYLDVSANLNIAGNIVYNGDLTVDGNLTVQGNIIQVGNIVTETLTIQLANAASTANAANGSGITVGANDNIATLLFSNVANAWTTNIGISSIGNITAPYFVGNGSLLTGLAASYGNSNVVTLLAGFGSNTVSTTGNISGGYLFGNGSLLTGLAATYGNANVVAYGESGWAGNIIPSGNAVYSLGNTTNQWNDLYVSNATIFMNNVPISLTAGNVLTVDGEAVLTNDSNTTITTTGNITANYFLGNIEGLNGNISGLTSVNFDVVNISARDSSGVNIGAGGYNNLVVLPTEVLIQNVPLTVAGNILSTVAGGLNITANTVANGVAQVWNFGTDGNLTVPGNIQSISTGIPFSSNISGINTGSPTVIVTLTDAVFGAAEIGQVTISGVVGTTQANNTWYYASIDPSNFVLYNDAAVTIPVNGNTWTAYISGGLAVSQGYSNISITGGNVSVTTGTGNTWLFGTDGILTFPGTPRIATDSDNFEVQAAESINFEANAVVNIYTDTSGTTYQWQFGDDGNLNLPNGGSINFNAGGIVQAVDEDFSIRVQDADDDGWAVLQEVDDGAGNVLGLTQLRRDQFLVEFAGGGAPQFRFTDNGEMQLPGNVRWDNYQNQSLYAVADNNGNGTVELKTISYASDTLGSNIRVSQSNATISTSNAAHTWLFDNTGNLTLPLGGNIVGQTADNSGSLHWVGNSSGDGNGYTTIQLIPDDTLVNNDQYLILDPTSPGHIHLRAGGTQDNSSAMLFLGGENSHFKVNSGSNPSLEATANNYSWTFGTNGTFTLPGDNTNTATSQITSVGNSSGDGYGYTTLQLRPDSNVAGDSYLIIDPTAPNHIHIRAGGTQDNSGAQLYLGGETSYFMVENGLNPNVYVQSNSNQWKFNTTGVLNLPGEGVLQSFNDSVTLSSLNTTTGNANSVYLGTSGGLGFSDQEIGGNWLEIFRNGTEPEIRVPVGRGNLNIQTAEGINAYNWTFDNTGNLTVPGRIIVAGGIVGSGASPAPSINGFSSVNSVTVNASGNVTGGNLISSATIHGSVDIVLGNIANTSATKTRIVSFDANSYIQTGNGTSGTTGNIIFSPYTDATARVSIDTSSGNLTASGNILAGRGVVTAPVALANLTAVAGGRAFINNGNLVAAGNFGAQVGSGGSNVVPVWSDGTNWYIG